MESTCEFYPPAVGRHVRSLTANLTDTVKKATRRIEMLKKLGSDVDLKSLEQVWLAGSDGMASANRLRIQIMRIVLRVCMASHMKHGCV